MGKSWVLKNYSVSPETMWLIMACIIQVMSGWIIKFQARMALEASYRKVFAVKTTVVGGRIPIVSALGILLLLLTGCIEQGINLYPVRYPNIIYYGDSLCESTVDGIGPTAQNIVGVIQDCRWGRALMDLDSVLPKGYDLYFIALGSNDAFRHVAIKDYTVKLRRLIASTKKPVVCVLPNAKDWRFDKHRTAMKTVCTNIIDPNEWGVEFRAIDGIHMTPKDHRIFAPVLQDVITSYHL